MDVKLGRIEFEWPLDDVPEELGGAVDTVGRRVVAGEPSARKQPLKVPVRIEGAATNGERLRRQVRSLLNNEEARKYLYLKFESDPELNGWVSLAGGDLTDQAGGSTFGEWQLELRDMYRLGSLRTNLPARRLEAYDRRLATTPRDYLKRLYSTDFAAKTATARHFLPFRANVPTGFGGVAVTLTDGGQEDRYVDGRPHGEVLSFMMDDTDEGVNDVLALDPGDFDNTWATWVKDDDPYDPQTAYGWEEMYGPDYPHSVDTSETPPILENFCCRVRPSDLQAVEGSSAFGLRLDSLGASSAPGDISPYATVAFARNGTLLDDPDFSRLVEYTPERAVLAMWFANRAVAVYVTLQRGWKGPRVEMYGAAADTLRLRIRSVVAGATKLGRSSGTVTIGSGTSYGNFSAIDPWIYIRPDLLGDQPTICVAPVRASVAMTGRTVNSGVDWDNTGYVSATFDGGATASTAAAQTRASKLGETNLVDARVVPALVSV